MPWPNARTCRQPCDAARLAPRLTVALVLLVTALVMMGSLPTVSGQPQGVVLQPAAPPGAAEAPGRRRPALDDVDPYNQTGADRGARSLSLYPSIKNAKWLVSKGGSFIVIKPDGTVETTQDNNPLDGILLFGSTYIDTVDNVQVGPLSDLENLKIVTTIKGKEANRYLCINSTGRLYSRAEMDEVECGFNSTVLKHNFETLCQYAPPSSRRGNHKSRRKTRRKPKRSCDTRCIGVSKRGKIRNSKRVCVTDESAKMNSIAVDEHHQTSSVDRWSGVLTFPQTTPQSPPTHTRRPSGSRRRGDRRRNRGPGGRRNNRPKPTKEPCQGLFCKDSERSSSRTRRPHRASTGRSRGRQRSRRVSRRRKARQRRAYRAEGPLFADIT